MRNHILQTLFSFWIRTQICFPNAIQNLQVSTEKLASLKQINHDMITHAAQA